MDYKQFKNIFNKTIFEKSKPDLIRKIALYPERYIGLFRPTKPQTKIVQNLSQSHEIRFGDAFELLIEEYLKEKKYHILDKKIEYNNEKLEIDQLFSNNETIFFVEQKIRDDHDSTKKRGQIDNFERKIEFIIDKYSNTNLQGFFYFIDDSFNKNKNFYQKEIDSLSKDYGISLHLCYGKEFFECIKQTSIWEEILKYLKEWKKGIPSFPEINFDKNPKESFDEIMYLETSVYRKFFSNKDLDPVVLSLFPEQKTLKLLENYFHKVYQEEEKQIYKTLIDLCEKTIRRII